MLKPCLALASLLIGLLADAGGASGGTLYRNQSITVGGLVRTFDLFVPSGLDADPVPLVLLLHGHGGDADQMTGFDGSAAPFRVWMDLAERDTFLVAYPDGVISPDGDTGWNDCRADAQTNPSTDDVAFLDALVDQIALAFPIVPTRIHAAGVSNGGFMTLRLAAENPTRYTSVAAVISSLPAVPECPAPTSPVSVLFMNGTADPLVPWAGGVVHSPRRGTVISTPDSVRLLAEAIGTDPVPLVEDLPDLDPRDRSTVRRFTFDGGAQGTRVVLYAVLGGGHTTPSRAEQYHWLWELIVGPQNHDIESADAIWAFFEGL